MIIRTLITLALYLIYFSLCDAQAPANDICADAIELQFSTDCFFSPIFDNTGATGVDPDVDFDPVCISEYGNDDVWFYLEVPSSGKVFVDFYDLYFIIKAEVYSGDCQNLEIVLDDFGNCTYRDEYGGRLINLNRPPGEKLYIRIFSDGFGEGEYQFCAVEHQGSNNNDCTNPVELTVSNEIDFQYYSTLGLFQDSLWFSFEIPSHFPYANVNLYIPVFNGPYNSPISVHENSCNNLELIRKTGTVIIENNGRGNQKYLISIPTDYYGFDGVFAISAYYKENDFCEGAKDIPVNSACTKIDISTFGSTKSENPTPNVNCGYYPNGYDAWINSIVPASGNITFEISLDSFPPEVTFENSVEFYKGNCSDLEILFCDGRWFTENNNVHKIDFTNLIPGSIIYGRLLMGATPEGFKICAYEADSYEEICRVDAVIFHKIGACNPDTDLFQQEFEVYYTAPQPGNYFLNILGSTFQLTSNPDTFVMNLTPNGRGFSHQLTSISGDCSTGNIYNYRHFNVFTLPEECPMSMTNDNCEFAIEIDNDCSLNNEYFPNNPTISSQIPQLSLKEDIWFKYVNNETQNFKLFYNKLSGGFAFKPKLEAFKGNCDLLEAIPNPLSSIGDHEDPLQLFNISIGETIFIRVTFNSTIDGSFSFCAENICYDEEFVTGPLNIDTLYQANRLVSSNGIIGNNSNVVFQSNQCIELKNGFEVPLNHSFEALLDNCN